MNSRISIEVNFENKNLPVIQVITRASDDVRDQLLRSFIQSLQHTSRWCTIKYIGEANEDGQRWYISPVLVDEIPQEISLMKAVLPNNTVDYSIADNSTGFREFLKKEGVSFESNELFTSILRKEEYPYQVDIFQLGRKYEKYYQDNK